MNLSSTGIKNIGSILTSVVQLKVKDNRKVVLSIRVLSVLIVALYIVFFYKVAFPWYAYTAKLFVLSLIDYLTYGIGCNFGLFFITTTKAKKMKILATILYSPTVLITPMVVSLFSPYAPSVIATFLLSLLIFYYFNPWRRNV